MYKKNNGTITATPCTICMDEKYYKDNDGIWHECPKCNRSYNWNIPMRFKEGKEYPIEYTWTCEQ